MIVVLTMTQKIYKYGSTKYNCNPFSNTTKMQQTALKTSQKLVWKFCTSESVFIDTTAILPLPYLYQNSFAVDASLNVGKCQLKLESQ